MSLDPIAALRSESAGAFSFFEAQLDKRRLR
jgi:hypothetical protein